MQRICSTCENGSHVFDNHWTETKTGFTEETKTSKLSQGDTKLLEENTKTYYEGMHKSWKRKKKTLWPFWGSGEMGDVLEEAIKTHEKMFFLFCFFLMWLNNSQLNIKRFDFLSMEQKC